MTDASHSGGLTAESPAPGGVEAPSARSLWSPPAIDRLEGALLRARGWWRVAPLPAQGWDGTLQVREYLLLAISLSALLAVLPPVNAAILLATASAVYAIGESPLPRHPRLALLIPVLGIFVGLKYLCPRPPIPHVLWGQRAVEAFFILRCVDFGVSRRSDTAGLANWDRYGRFLLWIFFLPTVFAGPVASYREFYRSYHPEIANWTRTVLPNVLKIAWGEAKFAWLAPPLRQVSSTVMAMASGGTLTVHHPFPMPHDPRLLTAASLGLDLIALYLIFSGFTDMAIGLARLFGFDLYENFDRPLLSTNPVQYWKASNISTYRWLMTHVFYPYWGHRRVTAKVLTTFLVSALWHCTILPFGEWGGMLQVTLALMVFGVVVAASLQAPRVGLAVSSRMPANRWVRGLWWAGRLALTFAFLALVHRLFINGLAGRPLEETWNTYRRLFLGAS